MKLARILLGIVVPPVGVFLTYGFGPTLLINILLTLLGWVPGSIHAVWAITKHDEKLAAETLDQPNQPSEPQVYR